MKYALITGGSRGLGRAICLELSRKGFPLIINYQSNSEAAQEVKRLVEAQGGQAELLQLCIERWRECTRFALFFKRSLVHSMMHLV